MSKYRAEFVLFIMGQTCPFSGAGWRRISYFANYFTRKGYKSCILSTISPTTIGSPKIGREEDAFFYNLVPAITGVSNPFFLFLNNLLSFIGSLPFFLFIRPHVVIISIPPADQFFSTFILSKILKSKLVVDYRDEFEDFTILCTKRWKQFYLFLKKFLSCLYRRSYLITSVTPAVVKSLKQRGIFNIQVIHDGVDASTFKPVKKARMRVRKAMNMSEDVFIIVYLGNVYTPYRLDIVIEALNILKERKRENSDKYKLLMIGAGDVKSVLKHAESLKVEEMVKYVGQLNDKTEIVGTLNASDVGIIPYDDNPLWKKTLSTKLFEYCACGLPVIATVSKNSILAKYIEKHSIGITIPSLDSESLAKSLKEIRDELARGSIIPLNARSFAKKYDKRKIAEELLGYIH